MPDVVLPPFPVDEQTLDMLWKAMHPAPDDEAESSSLYDLLEMFSQLGGSETDVVAEVHGDISVMRDPQYHVNDVITALIIEIRELRAQWHNDFDL